MSRSQRPATAAGSLQRQLSRQGSAGRFPVPTLKDYVFTERLGSGTYATVYKAFRKTSNRETVAIKCVLKSSLNSRSMENLLTEIELLKLLDHEHIVCLKDFEWDRNYIYIVMEYCSGGDLMSFIRQKRALHEDLVRRFLQQIALALKYMREKNVSHLDLKPQNILLSSSSRPKLKIADFGFAHYLIGDVDTPYLKGSPLYMAPEIICSKHYDAKADLWSIGVILYECLFGRAPWASNTLAELAEKINENKPIQIPPGFEVSLECRDLVLRLLIRDPAERISFEEFFAHPFLELDRVPSSKSLPTAIEIVTEAIKEDSSGNLSKAIDLYVKALDHFIGALQYETDETKKDKMRGKIKEYLDRTELLRDQLKIGVEHSSTQLNQYQELRNLVEGHAQLPIVLDSQTKAVEMEKAGEYDKSLDRHQRCIQSLLKIAPGLPEGRLRELLYQHIQDSLTHAEKLKEYISSNKASNSKAKRNISKSIMETCHVQ